MPIILLWNETVSGRLQQFGRWLSSFAESSLLLERWLKARLRGAEELERLTASFPVLRFHNEAVTAHIAGFQHGALLTAPIAGVGDHVVRALDQWDVAREVRNRRREARLLPGLLRALEEITTGLIASFDRFREPTRDTFDPARLSAGDLPGLAALAWRSFASSRDRLVRAAGQVHRALHPPQVQAPDSATGSLAEGPATAVDAATVAPALPLAFRLDELARYVVAGLLVLPALGRLLGVLGRDILNHLRHVALSLFSGIEGQVHDLRRAVLELFAVDLKAYVRQAAVFLWTAKNLAIGYLQFYSRVGIEYLRGVTDGVTAFAGQFQTFWQGVMDVIHTAVRFGSAILAVEVGPQVHLALVAAEEGIESIDTHMYDIFSSPEEYEAPDEFAVTVGQLVLREGPGARAHRELVTSTRRVNAAWRGADPMARAINSGVVNGLFDVNIPAYIHAVTRLGEALALPLAVPGAQPTLTFDGSDVPNLTEEVLDPLRTGLNATIARGVRGVAGQLDVASGALYNTLGATSTAFEQAAEAASRMGSLALLERLTADTDALMAALFPSQARASDGGDVTPNRLEAVAGAYAEWLIQGGFDMVGSVLAGYVGMMLEQWLEHLAETRDLPLEVLDSSPRKVLRHARLIRVHTKGMRITATDGRMGRELAVRIADRFEKAIKDAYVAGQGQLARALAEAPAE